MADTVADDYRSSLADLNFNSKPHINVLTMVAEENLKHAPQIVETIVSHLNSVPPSAKLPSLYLVDSIMKNVGGQYITLFSKQMVALFTSVFLKVDEATRSSLYKLRQTWNDILPKSSLYELDIKVRDIDPAWPVTAKPVTIPPKKAPTTAKNAIHVNPKFLPATPQAPVKSPINLPSKNMFEKKNEVHTPTSLNEMLQKIEEKKIQLKALELKKLEMAAKQKKAQQNNQQKKNLNHRDPRLKKGASESQHESIKSPPLQSIVVMPNVRAPPCDISNPVEAILPAKKSNLSAESLVKSNVNTDVKELTDHTNNASERVTPMDTGVKQELKSVSEVPSKKRSLSPEEKIVTENKAGKKSCKPNFNSKSKRLAAERECLRSSKEKHQSKRGKRDFTKSKNKQGSQPIKHESAAVDGLSSKDPARLFGDEDRDYRHQDQAVSKTRQWHQRGRSNRGHHNPRMSHVSFYPRPPFNDQNSKFHMLENRPVRSPNLEPPQNFDQNLGESENSNIKNDGNQVFQPISAQPNDAQNGNYNSNHGANRLQSQPLDPNGTPMLQDVDMRFKPSPMMPTSAVPESSKDMDWRHNAVPVEGSQMSWNGPKAMDTYQPGPQNRNFAGEGPYPSHPVHPSALQPRFMERPRFEQPMDRQRFEHPMERPRFEHPMERQRFEEPLHRLPMAPSMASWERQRAPLPPPPGIPPSLNLNHRWPGPCLPMTTIPSAAHGISGQSWNPLPPPPMFTGTVPEMVLTHATAPTISSTIAPNVCAPEPSAPVVPSLPVNVETIFDKLVAAGIITKPTKDNTAEQTKAANETTSQEETVLDEDEDENDVKEEIPLVPKNLREFRPYVIAALYRGSQCATCGMRFKEIQSEQYSRHLDWHFRMNRREKDGAKKAFSRRLFYEIKDWIQFKEVEEAEERTPSYFELQADGDSKNEEVEKIPSVPASECESEKCAVCGEQFQLFWVEEEEEWHLKYAVRHDQEVYHPLCYEDHKKAEEMAKKAAEEAARAAEEAAKAAEEAAKKAAEEAVAKAAEEAAKAAEEAAKAKEEAAKAAEEAAKAEEEAAKIKEEPPESPTKEEADDKEDLKPPGTEDIIIKKEDPEDEPVKMEVEESAPAVEEKPPPPKEEPVEQVLRIHSDADSEGEEFRPPTPDPRFDVQPPVFRSTEMSALCTIM